MLQYFPEQRQLVCIDGSNRYTRALYGGHSLVRLETSDRPVFAIYDGKRSRNIAFSITVNGYTTSLDSTTHCEARYRGGRRSYILTDNRWGSKAKLCITALATRQNEGAIWIFRTQHFTAPPCLTVKIGQVRRWKMLRGGDLGLEPRESYEAALNVPPLFLESAPIDTMLVVHYQHPDSCHLLHSKAAHQLANTEERLLDSLTSIVCWTTPDALINTLDANLVAAADGLWDGHTWLHGCIGWRIPLAGWRGAYVGDVLGWADRARSHFYAYANSQVTDIPPIEPHPTQDTAQQLSRGAERWGTPMYSNGYICRVPDNNRKMNHYDMNLNYVDELLWHFAYNADTLQLRHFWPLLKSHLAWEKRNWDPDNDHLYDAYCCIWASDALYYTGGAVTHSSAYNYRGHLLAARIAELLGEDPFPYRAEAEAIKKAIDQRLWLPQQGHWAEYQDLMGLGRRHTAAALWSIYTPIDCQVGTPQQADSATRYVDSSLPHIPIEYSVPEKYHSRFQTPTPAPYTIATSNWMPYDWSINNVAHEEVAHMALAYFEAGRNEEAYRLLVSDLMDEQLLGQSPGNFGQISYYDKARSEAYRDFGDNIGITARAIINGLFGVQPDALNGRCIIRQSWPQEWDAVDFKSPYIAYSFRRQAGKETLTIHQHFAQPLHIEIHRPLGNGLWQIYKGSADTIQQLTMPLSQPLPAHENNKVSMADSLDTPAYMRHMGLTVPHTQGHIRPVDLSGYYNSKVSDIFKNSYLGPRPPYTTLQLPLQGIGQWCHPHRTAVICDSILRQQCIGNIFHTGVHGVYFHLPQQGNNIAYTSLWNNYPDSINIKLCGKATHLWLLLAGSTNHMQSRIDNALVTVTYKDGSHDTLPLLNPVNWCPIEQDYYTDNYAFRTSKLRPYRIHLGSGTVSRDLRNAIRLENNGNEYNKNTDSAEGNLIPYGAAEMLCMPLQAHKKLKKLTLRTLSNDVVVGLMGLTLEQ